MGIATGIVAFIIIWWATLFAVLPFWVRGQWEEGAVDNGSEPGAPVQPHLWRKFAITTLIAVGLWGVVYVIITSGVLAKIPFDWLFGAPPP